MFRRLSCCPTVKRVANEHPTAFGGVAGRDAAEAQRLDGWWAELAPQQREALLASWTAEERANHQPKDALAILLEPRFIDPAAREAEEDQRDARADDLALLEWINNHPEYQWFLVDRTLPHLQSPPPSTGRRPLRHDPRPLLLPPSARRLPHAPPAQ